jgi:hypothetical protein
MIEGVAPDGGAPRAADGVGHLLERQGLAVAAAVPHRLP